MAKQQARSKQDHATTVVVAGDVAVVNHIYEGARDKPYGLAKQGAAIHQENGGAMLLYNLLQRLGPAASEPFTVEFGMSPRPASKPVESYVLLTPCPAAENRKGLVWRITGNLGYGDSVERTTRYSVAPARTTAHASVVVLDDDGLGFRHRTNEPAWPAEIRDRKSAAVDWVVLKMSAPVAQGDLWRRVCEQFHDKLVAVVSAADLRQEEVSISEGLSWEHTAQDLLQQLALNKSISDLTRCRHLIIGLGTDGALWASPRSDGTSRYRLVFDPGGLEGAWARDIKGQVSGGMSCLVAAIVAELATPDGAATGKDASGGGGDNAGEADIGAGITRGLSAMRELLRVGHGAAGGGNGANSAAKPGFPPDPVVDDLRKPSSRYRIAEVPAAVATVGKSRDWTIASGEQGGVEGRPLYGLAQRVALFGSKALADELPYARFGKLMAVDRVEIESLRGLERLIKNYERNPRPSKPLSIAVFGAPGSGKSFGVKQIAKTVLGDKAPILEFNLSQFSDPGELIGAFHQVRDKVLGGTTPIVFWDEFDSREYMWLQYLLAPMQDGAFQEGQVTHPIGKCVFVFAGGTSYDFANFSPREGLRGGAGDDLAGGAETRLTKFEKFKLVKGPDFVSRLNGYLNVAGPNPRQKYDADQRQWVDDDDPRDLCFPVRRALLMRATGGFFGAAEGDTMDIDGGLLAAFLEIGRYAHGARSLETIMGLTRGAGLPGLRRSALPPEDQLSLHVDYDEFMELVDLDLPFKMNSEELAPAVHEFYRRLCRKEGWPITYDMEYAELPDGVKSRQHRRRRANPTGTGFRGTGRSEQGPSLDLVTAQRCSRNRGQHGTPGRMRARWLDGTEVPRRLVIQSGQGRQGQAAPLSRAICDAGEEDKEKDRNAVRHYPDIVALAGYKIVEAGSETRTSAQRSK